MDINHTSVNNAPSQEELRLQKLNDYDIIDSPAEHFFDHIVNLSAGVFNVPNAFIGFAGEREVFLKSVFGFPLPADQIMELFSLANANESNALPNQTLTNQFFITQALTSPEGYHMGFIVLYGENEITTTLRQLEMLRKLAEMVINQLETRMSVRKTMTAQDDRLHVLIHDLKNPMTTISLQSELLGRIPEISERAGIIAEKINLQSKRMLQNLNEILSGAKKVKGSYKPQKLKIDIREILVLAINNLRLAAENKNQTIVVDIENQMEIFGDPNKLSHLFFHLLDNSIKFSSQNTTVTITGERTENLITIAIADQGQGLSEEDLEHLFIKFAPLSTKPTNGEPSNGLGLIAAKMYVEMHKGKLWAESLGKNQGTTFFVELPVK
ncbi:sensor histidine kinase KdpD [Pedobacter sp. BMA]|uniref:sensor histidine kinase n=1 Tax=Pedobacter sp. BMA TaxID=1663685 RepID=UPI0006493D3C|nr:HAMP domain-containing sensor histidine kinase [Pedobacter sp. BMA]KLT64273.1 hypothetical protein AB669_17055 [Pedobacter sp. BMA]